jgi:putative endonuclease
MSKILSISIEEVPARQTISAQLGIDGERLAAQFLEDNGYRLVLSNFKVPVGRNSRGVSVTGEIDIVAVDEETLCFVEVKTRRSSEFAEPLASVTRRKQRQIIRTARVYRRIFNLSQMPHRYDVVSIILQRETEPSMELIKGFWSESKFRKKAWSGDRY